MSNLYSLEEALADSSALAEVAEKAGLTVLQARRVCAGLASLPIRQAVRICVAAEAAERRRKQ